MLRRGAPPARPRIPDLATTPGQVSATSGRSRLSTRIRYAGSQSSRAAAAGVEPEPLWPCRRSRASACTARFPRIQTVRRQLRPIWPAPLNARGPRQPRPRPTPAAVAVGGTEVNPQQIAVRLTPGRYRSAPPGARAHDDDVGPKRPLVATVYVPDSRPPPHPAYRRRQAG